MSNRVQKRKRMNRNSKRTQISKIEYAAVIASTAQKLTGTKTVTPTAKQVGEAQKQAQAAILKAGVGVRGGTGKVDKLFNKARSELSGISGMGDDECGGLWDAIKDVIIKAAPIAPFAAPALGLIGPTAAIIIKNRNKGKGAATPASSASPASPAAPSPTTSPPDQSNATSSSDLQQVSSGIYGEDIAAAYRDAEDSLIFGEGGGAAELRAAHRRVVYMPPSSSGDATITPLAYRVSLMKRATKLAGSGPLTTRHIYVAQKSLDHDLESVGVSMFDPMGRPGRVTR
jgi:hypothetical protein